MNFEIVINTLFLHKNFENFTNNNLLSLVNKFEDGEWWARNFDNFIWDNLKETALSERERKSLIGNERSLLEKAAQNLRLTDDPSRDPGKGSELAEILLYAIMKHYYRALPVVPKIFYKQNSRDPVKGADSVHIIKEGDSFSVWLGEAKFFNSIENKRLDNIVASVSSMLDSDKIKKENSLIVNVGDLNDFEKLNDIREIIRAALDQNQSIDTVKPKLNIPILLLHECKITESHTELSNEYIEKIKDYHKERADSYFRKQINKLSSTIHKYAEITFHLILFPVPKKSEIVTRFLKSARFYQN